MLNPRLDDVVIWYLVSLTRCVLMTTGVKRNEKCWCFAVMFQYSYYKASYLYMLLLAEDVELCSEQCRFLCLCHCYYCARGILFWGCPCVCPWSCTKKFVNAISYKLCLWEFTKFRTLVQLFGAVGNKDEQIRFWGQRLKGHGHSETTYGQI